MSHNALVFDGGHLVEAHYAALDPRADIVLVNDVVQPTGYFPDDYKHAMQRLETLTPLLQYWWQQRDFIKDATDELKLGGFRIQSRSTEEHIDLTPVVGYVASVNISDQPRSFYATRQGVPRVVTEDAIDIEARWNFANTLGGGYGPPTEEWVTVKPGAMALFGALPHLAVHASEGDTLSALLGLWQPKTPQY